MKPETPQISPELQEYVWYISENEEEDSTMLSGIEQLKIGKDIILFKFSLIEASNDASNDEARRIYNDWLNDDCQHPIEKYM
jgi:hypothetical protein